MALFVWILVAILATVFGALGLFVLFAWLESLYWKGGETLNTDRTITHRPTVAPTDELEIIAPGAYAPAEQLFYGINPPRGGRCFVENPGDGYDSSMMAEKVAKLLIEHPEFAQYTRLTIIALSMGGDFASKLIERLARSGQFAPENVRLILISTPMRPEHMRQPLHHLVARFAGIGPKTNAVLTPVVRRVLFQPRKRAEWGPGATEAGINAFIAEVQRRFTARAVFAHAKAALTVKEMPAGLQWWYQRITIVYLWAPNDPVVDNRAVLKHLEETHRRVASFVVFPHGKEHCSLPERPDAWNAAIQYARTAYVR